MATLHELSEDALVEILTRPKNALVRQYQRLFDFENVKLEFTDEALHAVAQQSMSGRPAHGACAPSSSTSCST